MRLSKHKLFNKPEFEEKIKHNADNKQAILALFKKEIKSAIQVLRQHHQTGTNSSTIIQNITWLVDSLVILVWKYIAKSKQPHSIQLIAVGGYGRKELHPYSDIDLLILLDSENNKKAYLFIETFIQFLWDIGFNVGHSVRTLAQCIDAAKSDITIMTNLLEARHLIGEPSYLQALDKQLRTNIKIWPNEKYFKHKLLEQKERHQTHHQSDTTLEPNVQQSPGCLRDLHTILWVYNRHYGTKSFGEMHQQGHINESEYRMLIRARNILWKIRISLHFNHARKEDRFLFDTQRKLAHDFGYLDTKANLAVEQLMKRYYRTVKQTRYLNEVLLSHFKVHVIQQLTTTSSQVLSNEFVLKDNMIQMRHSLLFEKTPIAMLRLFALMQKKEVEIIHPDTIRSVRENLHRVNNSFRSKEEAKSLFIELFKHNNSGLADTLFSMNSYGVLGAYLPVFGAIVGQMQHDLFHIYTVDGHTLTVIKNICDFKKNTKPFPFESNLFQQLHKPERLLISALFHDIAKGRGGNHSELGEIDAKSFCLSHSMSKADTQLINWLVKYHLIMSEFSQRRDISDPMVIQEFTHLVNSIESLDNLYLLTHADIRGTSPKLWSAWKGQLLRQLYNNARHALIHGITQPEQEQQLVKNKKEQALEKLKQQLSKKKYQSNAIEEFWKTLPNDYFLRNDAFYIAWHAATLYNQVSINLPIVSIRYSERFEANMVFIFTPQKTNLLTQVTASFDQLDLNIIEARLQLSHLGFALYTFKAIVHDTDAAQNPIFMQSLQDTIRLQLMSDHQAEGISRRNVSRALKQFPIKAKVTYSFDKENMTTMEIIAQDQPALLHNVALILQQHNIILLSARIATFGERVEDIFYIQTKDKQAVQKQTVLKQLSQKLCRKLNAINKI